MSWVLSFVAGPSVSVPEETPMYVKSPNFITWDLEKALLFNSKEQAEEYRIKYDLATWIEPVEIE